MTSDDSHSALGQPRVVRLVGDAGAVAWVVEALRVHGIAATAEEAADAAPGAREGPIVWVARPSEVLSPGAGTPERAVWSIPSLLVVPPGGAVPATLAGLAAVESFEIVREPQDAGVLALRLERLLLLHRRKTQMEIVLHNLSDVVYTRTFDGILTSVNAAGERLFGRKREDLLGRRLLDMSHPVEVPEEALARTNAELQAAGRTSGRIEFADAQGRRRVFDRDALLLRDGHGRPVGVQVILTDVTEELAGRERLEREAERNEILAAIASAARDSLDLGRILGEATALLGPRLDALSVRIWILEDDKDTCTLAQHWRADERVPELLGERVLVSQTDSTKQLFDTLRPIVVRDPGEPLPKYVASLLATLGAQSLVTAPIHREGEMIGILGVAFARPRPFPPDEVLFVTRVADQLALAIRAARLYAKLGRQVAELADAQRQLEEEGRARERLSAMLVHDLNNPLAAVIAALELTLDRMTALEDQRLTRMLRGSLASARGLQGLIEDVLLVYRPSTAPQPERFPCGIADALSTPVEEARWLAQIRRVTLLTDLPEDLPLVPLDLPRFRRAAANLLGNALKYTPPGGEVVVSAALRSENGASAVVFEVADTGPGIPEPLREQLATPWLRLPSGDRLPGTGLGLTVAQQVARNHGGRLEVRGRDGGGSIFSIVLPASPPRA